MLNFICLPGLLFAKFRFGWKVSVHVIPQKSSSKPSLQTFMVVAEKENSSALHQIISLFDHSSLGCNGSQVAVFHAFSISDVFS